MIAFVQTRMPSLWKQNLPTQKCRNQTGIRSNNPRVFVKGNKRGEKRRRKPTSAPTSGLQDSLLRVRLRQPSKEEQRPAAPHGSPKSKNRGRAGARITMNPKERLRRSGEAELSGKSYKANICRGRGRGGPDVWTGVGTVQVSWLQEEEEEEEDASRLRSSGGVTMATPSTGPSVLWSRAW